MGDCSAPAGGMTAVATTTDAANGQYHHRRTEIARRLRGAENLCGKFARFLSIIARAIETNDGPAGLASTREEAAYSLQVLARHLKGKGRPQAYLEVMAGFLELNVLGDP